jgi:GT2 family glycosyltransferase
MGFLPANVTLTLELIPSIIEHRRMLNRQNRTFLWKTEKLPGTAAATFRVKALRQVNGFDNRLKGAGEDMDVARRIKDAGWLIRLNDSIYFERYGDMSTLKDLCSKYFWYGYGLQSLHRKNTRIFSLPRMCPLAGFITGFLYSLLAYKLLRRKIVFLLPFHFALKMTAWCLGFIKSQIIRPQEFILSPF